MGCDIHPIVQVRLFGNYWRLSGVPYDMRDYGFFACLANQRNYHNVPSLAEGRGLPPGIPAWMREELFCGADGHSESWCTLAEMKQWDKAPTPSDHGGETWQFWIDLGNLVAQQHEVPDDDVRFVFSFDN